MKALRVYGNNIIKLENVADLKVNENEVKIRVKVCGVCGSDVPRIFDNKAHYYPIILGHEFSGVVVEKGNRVDKVSIGDHVAGIPLIPCLKCEDCMNGNYALCKKYNFIGSRRDGAMAEYIVVPESNVLKISENIDFKHAAFIEPISVVLHAFHQNNHRDDSNVAILGIGTIGCLAIQAAKIKGARNITAFVRNDKHNELAHKSGANNIVDTSKETWKEEVEHITKGRGFDYIYETAGAVETIKTCFEIAANKAHICLIGTPKASITFEPNLWDKINRKEFYLTGSWMSYSGDFPGTEWTSSRKYLEENKINIYPELINSEILLEEGYKLVDILKLKNRIGRNLIIIN